MSEPLPERLNSGAPAAYFDSILLLTHSIQRQVSEKGEDNHEI